jgi:hypothetical protein
VGSYKSGPSSLLPASLPASAATGDGRMRDALIEPDAIGSGGRRILDSRVTLVPVLGEAR